MAGPAFASDVNPLWNASTNTLNIAWSATITAVAGLATDIQLTDAAGLVWAGPGAVVAGAGTPIVLTRNYALAAAAVSTVTIAAAAFSSSGGDNLVITEHAYDLGIDHAAPYSKTDIDNLYVKLCGTGNFGIFGDGDFSGITAAQKTDLKNLVDHMLKASVNGPIGQAPRVCTQANALLTALNNYDQSSKDPSAYRELQRATQVLRAAMPPGATFPFAITSAGT